MTEGPNKDSGHPVCTHTDLQLYLSDQDSKLTCLCIQNMKMSGKLLAA